jgi:biopolymer transport protein TolR
MRTLSRAVKYRPVPVMNVTPLVDVVLVLLIIFMVIIPAMDKQVQVDLPGIFNVDEEAKSKTDPYTLLVTKDGDLYFEQERLAPDQFIEKLRAANQRDQSRRLILRADRSARYADVRALFKICQEVGFPGISLRVNELKQDNKH